MYYSSGSTFTSGVQYPSTFQPASRNQPRTSFIGAGGQSARVWEGGRTSGTMYNPAVFFMNSIFLQRPSSQLFNVLIAAGPPPDENIQVKYMRTFFGGFR